MYFISQWRWYYRYLIYKPWQRYGILFGLVFLAGGCWYYYVYAYLEDRILAEEKIIVQQYNQNSAFIHAHKKQERASIVKQTLQDRLASLYQEQDKSASHYTEMLLNYISKAGLSLVSYATEKEVKKEHHISSCVQCGMQGTVSQFVQLLQLIVDSHYPITLHNIQMTRAMNNNFVIQSAFVMHLPMHTKTLQLETS